MRKLRILPSLNHAGVVNDTLLSLGILFAANLAMSCAVAREIHSPDTDGNVGRFTSLALTAHGYPVISYFDQTNRDLKLLRCDTPNCNGIESGDIYILDSSGMVGSYTSLALDSTAIPVVSYYDSLNGALKLLRCDNDKCSSSRTSIPDLSSGIGMYSSLALDKSGNPVVSYYDEANGDLKLLHCDDPGCTGNESANINTPDTTGDVGLYTSLVLDTSGNPVISYYASKSGLRILHCDDPYCAGDESTNITTPDSGEVGWYSSIALDANGNPVVGYHDFSRGDLKVLHCDDPNCAGNESKNISSPHSANEVGTYLSMILNVKGNPVISYHDATNGDLKLLHCDDPNCSGDESGNIKSLDTLGEVGLHTSLALDKAGNPVVSYYDFTNGDLKIIHCTNQTCSKK